MLNANNRNAHSDLAMDEECIPHEYVCGTWNCERTDGDNYSVCKFGYLLEETKLCNHPSLKQKDN